MGVERGKGSGSDPNSHQRCTGKSRACGFECVISSLSCAEGGGWLLLSLPHRVSATPKAGGSGDLPCCPDFLS